MSNDACHSQPMRVRVYEARGETSIFIDAEIDADGNLAIEGQDVGKAPREFWGDDDYEYGVHVKAKDKDVVLLSSIRQVFGGKHDAVSAFRSWLNAQAVPNEFDYYI